MVFIKAAALAAVASLIPTATAHSWVEQMMVINGQGSFTGNPGYARNATARTTPGFSDPLMVHILPGQGQPAIEERDIGKDDTAGITPTDPMCKKTQQSQVQGSGLPRLSAAPGSLVALRYQENGHVTLPQNQAGKPPNRGTVYIYGTTQPKSNENFLDVFNQWNVDGTGGDKRGKLIATQPFDDGYCYQVNSGSISVSRQKQYPHTPNQLMGADLWCQNDIKIPSDAVSGKPYTLYWVWDWPTEAGADPSLPKGKAEIYTTCMDIDITAGSNKREEVKVRSPEPQASGNQGINNAAIPSYMSSLSSAGSSGPATPAPPAGSVPPASSAPPPATTPAAAPTTAPTDDTAMNPSAAASIVEEALGPEISSLVADKAGGATVTLTPSEKTVTVTAKAEPSPASTDVTEPSTPQIVTSSVASAVASSATPNLVVATPPSSMDIKTPVISAPDSPSQTPVSSVAHASALSLSDKFSGTAYPASAASPSVPVSSATPAASGTAFKKCKKAKRSRILGRAAAI